MSERAWQRPSSCVMGLHSTRLLANSSAGQDGNGPNRGRVEAVVSIGYPVGGRSIRSPATSCAERIRSDTPTMPSRPSRLTAAGALGPVHSRFKPPSMGVARGAIHSVCFFCGCSVRAMLCSPEKRPSCRTADRGNGRGRTSRQNVRYWNVG
jgi:hypothetical protein